MRGSNKGLKKYRFTRDDENLRRGWTGAGGRYTKRGRGGRKKGKPSRAFINKFMGRLGAKADCLICYSILLSPGPLLFVPWENESGTVVSLGFFGPLTKGISD